MTAPAPLSRTNSSDCTPFANSSRYTTSRCRSSSRCRSLLLELQAISQMAHDLHSAMGQTNSLISKLSGSGSSHENPSLHPIPTDIYHDFDSDTASSIGCDDVISVSSSISSTSSTSDKTPTRAVLEDLTPTPGNIPEPTSTTTNNPRPNPTSTTVRITDLQAFQAFQEMLDDIRHKQPGDYRLALQNTRGMKEFKEKDPEYVSTITALQGAQSDLLCFVETNTPWFKNDLLYAISTFDKSLWPTATKTIRASCRTEKNVSSNYLPGGTLNIIANGLTSKVQSTATDEMGRWSKIRFFAKGGAVVVYTVYRPNKATPATADVNSAWMQQYRHLSKTNKNCDPRKQLLRELEADIKYETKMHSSIIVVGDFNEDFKDNESDGIIKFMHACGLTQIFREKKNVIPSTRGNDRAIDRIFVGYDMIPMVRQVGMVPEEVGFSSDHSGLFIDLSPDILNIKNPPMPPAKTRKLKPKVYEYIKAVTAPSGFDESTATIIEQLDSHVTQIMLQAENNLAPQDTPYAFSAPLLLQMRKVRLLKLLLDKKTKNLPLEMIVNGDLEELAETWIRLNETDLTELLQQERSLLNDMQDDSWAVRE